MKYKVQVGYRIGTFGSVFPFQYSTSTDWKTVNVEAENPDEARLNAIDKMYKDDLYICHVRPEEPEAQ